VPIDADGLQVGQLESALRTGPKFMYILPQFQNPAGVTLSLTRRYEFVALAEEYGIPIWKMIRMVNCALRASI